jgi:hypothetical protein
MLLDFCDSWRWWPRRNLWPDRIADLRLSARIDPKNFTTAMRVLLKYSENGFRGNVSERKTGLSMRRLSM